MVYSYSIASRIPPDPDPAISICCLDYSTSFILRVEVIPAALLIRGLGASGDILGGTCSGLLLSVCDGRHSGYVWGKKLRCSGVLRTWDVLGATWSGIGLSWIHLEPIGDGLRGLLGSSSGLLGGSRGPLEAILRPLGAVLGPLGTVLGVILPQLDFRKKSGPIF